DLDVAQPMPLLRQRQKALGEEMQARRPDGELVGLGPEQPPLDADPVAEVEQLVDPEIELRHRVLPDVDLHLGMTVGQDQEVRLAEGADREDAASSDRLDAIGFELVVRPLAVAVDELRNGVAALERARIDLEPELLELRQVRPPLFY